MCSLGILKLGKMSVLWHLERCLVSVPSSSLLLIQTPGGRVDDLNSGVSAMCIRDPVQFLASGYCSEVQPYGCGHWGSKAGRRVLCPATAQNKQIALSSRLVK